MDTADRRGEHERQHVFERRVDDGGRILGSGADDHPIPRAATVFP